MGAKQSVVEGQHADFKSKFIHKIFEDMLNESVANNRPALYYPDGLDCVREMNFDVLNKQANRFAAYILEMLRETDANRNQDGDYVIGICMTTNDNAVATLLAIWKVGAAYLPLDPNLPTNRIQAIVTEVRPVLVIYDRKFDCSVNSISYNDLLTKSKCCSENNIHTQNSVSRGEDDVAVIFYNADSDGSPLGKEVFVYCSI